MDIDVPRTLFAMQIRATLSTLWIFVLLNMLFRDIHVFFREGLISEMATGTVNGTQVTEETLLFAGIVLEILLLMVILSRVLPYQVNRYANIIVGIIAIPLVLSSGQYDPDDMFFAIVEIIALLVIVFTAWMWSEPENEFINPKG
jgi:hypothetical protein